MGVAFFILYGTLYSLGVFMSRQKPSLWSSIISIFVAIVTIGIMRGITKDQVVTLKYLDFGGGGGRCIASAAPLLCFGTCVSFGSHNTGGVNVLAIQLRSLKTGTSVPFGAHNTELFTFK